jgi:hypothetical protein
MIYAQDMNFWATKVSIEKSRVEIESMLKDHGAKKCGGWFDEDTSTLTIVFHWLDKSYQMNFKPIKPDYDRGYKPANQLDKEAIRQMGRVALNYVKCSLQLAMNEDNAAMMVAFEQLPSGATIQQLGQDGMAAFLQRLDGKLALPASESAK